MSFSDITNEIVSEFLQTVVVLDDESYLREPESEAESNSEIIDPSPRGNIGGTDDENQNSRPPSKKHGLDAKILIDSFANNGQVCAVLAPAHNEDPVKYTKNVAQNADVVILDWQINGDDGEIAQTIIKDLIQEDSNRGGRLRLFVIYTGEGDLTIPYESVRDKIKILEEIDGDKVVLGCNNIRVKFVMKKDGEDPQGISEKELPNVIIQTFAEFAGGLVPNSVMAAIHQVRENAQHVLQRFRKELDGAFIAHRILLHNQEEASRYLIELIADELKATFDYSSLIEKSVGQEVLTEYITDGVYPCDKLLIKETAEFEEQKFIELKKEDVITSLDTNVFDETLWKKTKTLYKRIYPLFHQDTQVGRERYLELSRISSLRTEINSQLRTVIPQIKLGSILRTKTTEDYYVCLQPLCDCVRLEPNKKNPFIFGKFKESIKPNQPFELVINDDNKNICLSFRHEPFATKVFNFGSNETACIIPQKEGDKWFFTPSGNTKLIWIAELRPVFAQRLVHRIMSQLSRVGLDEFEWQRLHGNG
ncbi:response regulator receiver domain [Gimesia algae]|uniref:Response receiver domain-containing protein n=1 Tax=Gimesia algae TaxID=2527971 RepID=A0A517VLF3_9PLAN|nr:response regulator receiver domain [Gimesia algae]QDT93849.1 hypothetical protein Pan161_55360 [Gimesia algae]